MCASGLVPEEGRTSAVDGVEGISSSLRKFFWARSLKGSSGSSSPPTTATARSANRTSLPLPPVVGSLAVSAGRLWTGRPAALFLALRPGQGQRGRQVLRERRVDVHGL